MADATDQMWKMSSALMSTDNKSDQLDTDPYNFGTIETDTERSKWVQRSGITKK